MQDSGPITTATSQSEGRLKVGAGCPHGRKKCLKCALKKDGKGGVSVPEPGDKKIIYSKDSTKRKPHRSSRLLGGMKLRGISSKSTIINPKKLILKKVLKNSGKIKSLKSNI